MNKNELRKANINKCVYVFELGDLYTEQKHIISFKNRAQMQ